MTHVVVYDIETDRVRGRVATLLSGYGRRVQESVFECELEGRQLDDLLAGLKRELAQGGDGQVRVYRVCANCMQASFGIGQIKAVDTGSCYIV